MAKKLNLKAIGKTNVSYSGKNKAAIQPVFALGSKLSIKNLLIYGIDLSHNDHYNCDSVFGIIGMDIIRLGVWDYIMDQNIVIFNKSFYYTTKDLKEYQSIKLHTPRDVGEKPYLYIKTGRWKNMVIP